MIGLWLAGQSPGVAPGGVGVVYAPSAASGRDAGTESHQDQAQEYGAGVYPFSTDRWCLGAQATGRLSVPPVMRAGLALIGELEYGAEGLDGFVPRLFGAVNLPGLAGEGEVKGKGEGREMSNSPRREAGVAEQGDSAEAIAAASHAAGEMIGASVNGGPGSIGLTDRLQFVDRFDAEGVLGRARVVGFVERRREGGEDASDRQDACPTAIQLCEDVAVPAFPVLFEKLSAYLRFQVSAQAEGNGYDDLAGALAKSDRPAHAVVVVGVAGGDPHLRGAQVRLRAGDVCHSVVYDGAAVTREAIEEALGSGQTGVLEGEGVSWLRQVVE